MSTRRRLALVIAVLVSLGFSSLIPWQLGDLRPRYLATMEETLVDTANVLAAVLETEENLSPDIIAHRLSRIQRRDLSAQIYDLDKRQVDVWVIVTDDKGVVLYHSRSPESIGEDWSRWNDIKLTLEGRYGARTTWQDLGDGREEVLHIAAPIGPRVQPKAVLVVCKRARSAGLIIDQARRGIVATAALAGIAVLLIGLAATWWLTQPIASLTKYVHAAEHGSRDALPNFGPRDITKLAQAFESMRDALDGKVYVESYVQTLTHEMKAPVAGMRAAAELLQEDLSAADRNRFFENLHNESKRLQDLLDRILALAALERRRSLEQTQPVDIVDIISEILHSVEARSHQQNIRIDWTPTAKPVVQGERFLLRQAIDNLLANALDFAPSGSVITIDVSSCDGHAHIRIRNQGPAIPDYALPRIFERFYSLPRPGSGRKSTGLGLPFVREVATLHGGSASVTNHAEGGVEAVLIV